MTNDEALVERVVAEIKRSAAILRPDELAVVVAGVMRQALSASTGAVEAEREADIWAKVSIVEMQFHPGRWIIKLDPEIEGFSYPSPEAAAAAIRARGQS